MDLQIENFFAGGKFVSRSLVWRCVRKFNGQFKGGKTACRLKIFLRVETILQGHKIFLRWKTLFIERNYFLS